MSALTSSIARSAQVTATVPIGERGTVWLPEIFPAGEREIAAACDILKRGHRSPDVFLLRRGLAFIYRILADGRRQILHFALPEEVLNPCAGIGGAATASIQALTDVAISAMPRDQFDAATQLASDLGRQLAARFETGRLIAYEHMTNIGRRSARERIANLLLELFCRTRGRLPQTPNESAPMPMTQNVIADALGLTSVHVNRTLRCLRDEGILRLRHGTMLVLDPDRFIELADLSHELLALITRENGRDTGVGRTR